MSKIPKNSFLFRESAPEKFTESLNLNQRIYNDYIMRLSVLAQSVFDWTLPSSMNARFLEKCLFYNGKAIFINDPVLGFLNLRIAPIGQINVYEEHTIYQAYSINYSKNFERSKCAVVRNNLMNYPTFIPIQSYAQQLTEIDRTRYVNLRNQKTPLLLVCDEEQKLSMKQLYMQYDGNEPIIFGNKKLHNFDGMKAIKTDVPFLADKLTEQKEKIWNEINMMLGIRNVSEKRERLITDEVISNNESIDMWGETMLLTRKKACEEFNSLYPEAKLDVKFRSTAKSDFAKLQEEVRFILNE